MFRFTENTQFAKSIGNSWSKKGELDVRLEDIGARHRSLYTCPTYNPEGCHPHISPFTWCL